MFERAISVALAGLLAVVTGSARAADVELGAYGGGTTRTQEDDTLATPGPVLGLTSLAWLSDPVGVGVLVEYGRWNWTEAARGGGGDAELDTLLVAAALRWSPFRGDTLQPFLQVAAGYGLDSGPIRSGDGYCSAEFSPLRAQLSLGADVPVTDWARMGASTSASGGPVTLGCLDVDPGYETVDVAPGWMLTGQLTFTTLWTGLL